MKGFAFLAGVWSIAIGTCLWAGGAIAQVPDSVDDAGRHFAEAGVVEERGDLEGALREYSEAIRLNAKHADAYSRRCAVYEKLGRKWRALLDVRKAIELDPDNQGYRRQLKELLRKRVDLRTWNVEGYKENGQWEVASDGKSVLQKINRSPTFFVSPDVLMNTTIEGKFKVEDEGDDDYIGFVMGYRSPLAEKGDKESQFEFLLFDWKGQPQDNAEEGFSLVRVRGSYDYRGGPDGGQDVPGFWSREATPQFQILATDLGDGKGWKPHEEHEFELLYTANRIRISVDGKQIFDVEGDFPAGHFGFYNYSQKMVRYTGFTTTSIEPPSFLSVTSDEDDLLSPGLVPAVELVLDSSASMSEQIGATPKSEIARSVMLDLLAELPDTLQVGLRLYGYWGVWIPRRTDPNAPPLKTTDPRLNTDSQLVVPIRPLTAEQRAEVKRWLEKAHPRGKTPLVYSLLQAKDDFPDGLRAPKTVVLVSDGKETCGGKFSDVAKAYRGSDLDVVIHVVGFDVEKDREAKQQLMEIAQMGGGKYFNATNARQLAAAFREAVKPAEYEVLDSPGRRVVFRGRVNADPVELEPGRYQVRLVGADTEPAAIELSAGQSLELSLDESGGIAIATEGRR